MRIASIETRRYRFPLDPPFNAAWDPAPREHQEATLVLVHTEEGVTGYGSGDPLPDRELLERLLVGVDPLRGEVVRELCETVDFHGSRPWPCEVAAWDAAARGLGLPLWRLLGGRNERLLGNWRQRTTRNWDKKWDTRLVALLDPDLPDQSDL